MPVSIRFTFKNEISDTVNVMDLTLVLFFLLPTYFQAICLSTALHIHRENFFFSTRVPAEPAAVMQTLFYKLAVFLCLIWCVCVLSEVVFHPPLDTLFSPRTPEKRTPSHWSFSPLLPFSPAIYQVLACLSYRGFICICKPCPFFSRCINESLIVRKHCDAR